MKPLSNGNLDNLKKVSLYFLVLAFILMLGGVLFATRHEFFGRLTAQQRHKTIAMAADWVDIETHAPSDIEKSELLRNLSSVPFQMIVVPMELEPEKEQILRSHRFGLIWKLTENFHPEDFRSRVQSGDGLMISSDRIIDNSAYPQFPVSVINKTKGFAAMLEFAPLSFSRSFYRQVSPNVVKTHLLATREMITPNPQMWKQRLLRAVKERWARLLILRYSPALTSSQNLSFFTDVSREITSQNFNIGMVREFPAWPMDNLSKSSDRQRLIFFIALLAPVLSFLTALRLSRLSPFLAFVAATALTLFSGLAIYSLGCHPDIVQGISPIRGIKLQLLVPLFLAAFTCVSFEEARSFLEIPIKVKHLVGIGGGLLLLLFLYISRSGNNPLLPVSGAERWLRDVLESSLTVRPRFKEFLIGHPLFILGLYLNYLSTKGSTFMETRLFLLIGLLGQISILNTFMHVYTPVSISILRSFHGAWIGFLLSLPLSHFYSRFRLRTL